MFHATQIPRRRRPPCRALPRTAPGSAMRAPAIFCLILLVALTGLDLAIGDGGIEAQLAATALVLVLLTLIFVTRYRHHRFLGATRDKREARPLSPVPAASPDPGAPFRPEQSVVIADRSDL